MPPNPKFPEPAEETGATPAGKVGPGRLVLVVGPSGAGKDTVIGIARRVLAGDRRVTFPRRVVTRSADATEDHDTLDAEAFAAAERAGVFAFSWRAHGLAYGVPAQVETDLAAGRSVVCNVSRGVVETARRRYANVAVVLVTAPEHVLRARIAARGRGSDDPVERASRIGAPVVADLVIENVGPPEAAGETLARYLAS